MESTLDQLLALDAEAELRDSVVGSKDLAAARGAGARGPCLVRWNSTGLQHSSTNETLCNLYVMSQKNWSHQKVTKTENQQTQTRKHTWFVAGAPWEKVSTIVVIEPQRIPADGESHPRPGPGLNNLRRDGERENPSLRGSKSC